MLSKMPPELISVPGGPAGGHQGLHRCEELTLLHEPPLVQHQHQVVAQHSVQPWCFVVRAAGLVLCVPVSYGEDGAGGESVLNSALYGVVSLHIHRGRRLVQQENLVPEWELQ